MLKSWKASRRADTDLVLVSPYPAVAYAGMLPGVIAGHYHVDEAVISLTLLLQSSGVRHIHATCNHIDAAHKKVHLSNGEVLPYDTLSIDIGSVMDRASLDTQMPGARANAMFVRPLENFLELWPQLLTKARERSMQIAVVGAGATGVELALALQHQLPHCRVALICSDAPPAANYPPALQKRALHALKKATITVLQDRCVGIAADRVLLHSGASLSCDAPIVTTGGMAPPWLASSGLALDAQGYVQVNAFQQSMSHPDVFAVGDVSSVQDAPRPKSGVYAVRAAPTLDHNLRARLTSRPGGQKLKRLRLPLTSLNLVSCGGQRAIASWSGIALGGMSWWGWALWKWKDVIDRRWIRQYQQHDPESMSTQLLVDSTQPARLESE